ncbi:AAA-like domain-containing protein [Nostoc sp.]
MPRSLKVRTEYLPQVRKAMWRNGYISQRVFAEVLSISQSTISNFCTGKPVDFSYFTEICEKLALGWRDIADFETPVDTETEIQREGGQQENYYPLSFSSLTSSSLTFSNSLEYPEGQVALTSCFYIERPPIEQRCYNEIHKLGSLIRIKAPQQMGKSSLLVRILHQAEIEGDVTVTVDFQLAEEEFFTNLNSFLRWFCNSVSQELTRDNQELQHKLLQKLDEHWNLTQRIGSMKTCKDYFERYVFPEFKQPFTLSLETVDRLFEYPKIYKDFFSLLRSLHEESKRRDIWKKLRLVIVHSTEAYVPMDINQSPFNVGLSVELPEFTHKQVNDLVKHHQLDWSGTEVEKLMAMVGGHPFLVRLALYKIASKEISLAQLLQTAPTAEGIYSSHLQHQEIILTKQPELRIAMREVVASSSSVLLKTVPRFKLHSMGLVRLQGDEVTPRCELYREYFRNY